MQFKTRDEIQTPGCFVEKSVQCMMLRGKRITVFSLVAESTKNTAYKERTEIEKENVL